MITVILNLLNSLISVFSYKTSSSMRSRPSDSQRRETVTPSSCRGRSSTNRNRHKKDTCEPDDTSVSPEDSCRPEDSKRVTRSANLPSSKPDTASQDDFGNYITHKDHVIVVCIDNTCIGSTCIDSTCIT